MKIRDRLSITLSVTVLLTLGGLGFFVYTVTADFHEQEFFRRLEERVQLTELIFLEKNEEVTQAVREKFLQTLDGEKEYVLTLQQSGLDSLDLLFKPGLSKEIRESGSVTFWKDNRQGVCRIYDIPSGRYAVVVTAIDVFSRTKLTFLRDILIAGAIVCMLLLVLVSWISTGRALRPLERKIQKAAYINASRLNVRLRVENPKDELGELAITFNNMLDRLQAAFEAQRQFVSNASHEIRNPLTAIIGEAEILLTKDRSTEEYKEALHIIRKEARRLNKLTQQLLDLAKADALASLPDQEELSLDHCLLEVLEKFPVEHLHLEIEESGTEPAIIGNAHLLNTALSNLVDNALKYSGGKPVTIEFYQTGKKAHINIKDQGIGIPASDLGNIFQPLYRARNSRGIKGFGVGLALAQKIIELHGGQLEIQSEEGVGSTVFITLPMT